MYNAEYVTSYSEELKIKARLQEGVTLARAVLEVLPWLRGCEWTVDVDRYPHIIGISYNPSQWMAERRDEVDNLCYQLALDVAGCDSDSLVWDMEYIGEIRDAVLKYLVDKTEEPAHIFYP